MATTKSCRNCRHLDNCRTVTEQMLAEEDRCRQWDSITSGQQSARDDIIADFGSRALRYESAHLNKKSVKPRPRRRKRHV